MITFQIKSNVLKKKAEDALVVALDNELMEDEYGEESFLDVPEPVKRGFFKRVFSYFIRERDDPDDYEYLDFQLDKIKIESDIRTIKDVISTCEIAPPGAVITIDSVVGKILNRYAK